MKILVVDQYYYPERFQINDICEQMVADGHEVTVLTGLPNYPTGIVPEDYRHGKKRDETINGVHVIRSFEIGRKKGPIGMSINYLSYALSASIKQRSLPKDFDIVFIYETSPVTLAYPAEKYARKSHKPVFFYCCDIWPECVKVMLHNEDSIPYKAIKKISTKLYKNCDILAVQSKGFFDYFKDVHGIAEEKLRYLPQFADSQYLEKDFTPEDNGTIDFVFTGNIGIAQDIDGLLKAVEINRNIDGFKVHLVGAGSFLDRAKEIVKEKKLEDKVIFYGRRPYEEMEKFYKLADVCLATLQANSEISLTIPSKVQGYMAAGKPVIAALSGFARNVIEHSGSGICVEPGNSDQLAEIMRDFIQNPEKYQKCGDNARSYFKDHFTKEQYMKSLYEMFDETINTYQGRRK